MQKIQLLDDHTIDQIAAGEVVERPASIVKELVENAMDSGADAITVEIKGGGIDFIRVTDNGCGISAEDIPLAFQRHATSKIESIEDLHSLHTMGFRGEALASIASVCKVKLITKQKDELLGHEYVIEAGKRGELNEIGAPEGTTIIATHLFYNTPVRRKFLRSATAEAGTVAELMEHLALSCPEISFKYVQNGTTRFHTSGSGELMEVIYRIYGREAANSVVPVSTEIDGIRIDGYLGSPVMNRPNRNFENYFLNRRYIKSDLIARSIEEGYKGYMMQHKFPFCVLHLTIDSSEIDVNVHPNKMDVRFHDREKIYEDVSRSVSDALHAREMIPEDSGEEKEKKEALAAPEPFERERRETKIEAAAGKENEDEVDHNSQDVNPSGPEERDIFELSFDDENDEASIKELRARPETSVSEPARSFSVPEDPYKNAKQLEMLPKERVISESARGQYRLLGCIFNTYWMFSWQDKLYFVDQHAAHEKVNYERLLKQYQDHEVFSQQLAPPIVVSLSPVERESLKKYGGTLTEMGFGIEEFGGNDVALSAVPMELYRSQPRSLFLDILNDLSERGMQAAPDVINRVLASMACKGAVKGGDVISPQEMEAVLDDLLTLNNPYHCPHGRPTIFSMSRSELERRFKRIVS
ncbi:MAG: DNA mismatch repair endonuclease MutL [Lachnospiraceae bacterium]|nr:DNA mismatch repair endonuclease MutL [Lachnospiraceae bacterium]